MGTLEQGGSHAEMRVATFFQPRRLELAGGARLRAGVRVSARWLPTSDEWSGYDASTVVEMSIVFGVTSLPPVAPVQVMSVGTDGVV